MDICPICSHSLLAHLHAHSRYWYCQHCRSETANSFITARNKSSLNKSFNLNRERSALISADFSI